MTGVEGRCPHCSKPVERTALFCPNCGGRLSMAAVRPSPPVAPAPSVDNVGRGLQALLVVGIVAVLAVGGYLLLPRLAPGGVAFATPTPAPARTNAPTLTQRPSLEPAAQAPANTFGTTQTYGIGETITISTNGTPWAQVTVSQVSEKAKYAGEFDEDVPAAGHVYIQAFVTYEALTDGVDYGPYDWQVFADQVAVDAYAGTFYGPTPELGSGTLPKGRKAEGWVVYEVPKSGTVVMSYGGTFSGEAPVFEVVIRS